MEETAEESPVPKFNHICRLCLDQADLHLLKNINNDFIPIIAEFFKVFLDTKVPENICEQCLKELTQMATFVKKSKDSVCILQRLEEMDLNCDIKIEITDSDVEVKLEEANECFSSVEVTEASNEETQDDSVDCSLQEQNLDDGAKTWKSVKVCEKCGETVVNMRHHYKLNKECRPKNFKCSDCAMSFPYKSNLRSHQIIEHQQSIITDDPDQSKVCDKCGETVGRMVDHYKASRECKPKNIQCPDCRIFLDSRARLESHKAAHHWTENDKVFMCHICSKTFKYERNLQRHINKHIFRKRFVCEKCGKAYTTKYELQCHMNRHAGVRPYPCAYCPKTFGSSANRYLHQKRHQVTETGPRKIGFVPGEYICDLCEKVCLSMTSLKLHKAVHDENRKFECSICKEEFNSKLWLNRHAKTHASVKAFQCTYCFKRFKMQGGLKTHMRIHTGERPFKCPECTKTFIQRNHLTCHVLTHKEEKPFECTICSKSFRLKENLTVHIRIHTGEKPYPCHVCDESFRDSSGRKRHVVNRHGEGEVPNIGSADLQKIDEYE